MEQKFQKKFFVFEIITSELVLAANVLTSSPRVWHVNKKDFFENNFLACDKWLS